MSRDGRTTYGVDANGSYVPQWRVVEVDRKKINKSFKIKFEKKKFDGKSSQDMEKKKLEFVATHNSAIGSFSHVHSALGFFVFIRWILF